MTTSLLTKDVALHTIRLFTKHRFRDMDRKNAVLLILENTEAEWRSDIATWTVNIYLNDFEEPLKKNRLLQDHDALVVALSISEIVTIEHSTAERLVNATAKAGFHGRFPKLPERLLGRKMNENDIVSLVSSYVNNHSSQCDSDEEKFIGWINEYLPYEIAQIQIERIQKFKEDFENEVDL